MINLKLVFRSLKGRCQGKHFLVLERGCRWTQSASGAAGRAIAASILGLPYFPNFPNYVSHQVSIL